MYFMGPYLGFYGWSKPGSIHIVLLCVRVISAHLFVGFFVCFVFVFWIFEKESLSLVWF